MEETVPSSWLLYLLARKSPDTLLKKNQATVHLSVSSDDGLKLKLDENFVEASILKAG